MIFLDPNQTSPVECTGCHAVVTNDGRTVWVCEHCGEENMPTKEHTVVDPVQAEVAAAAAQVAPVVPEEKPAV